MTLTVVPATISHVYALERDLRAADRAELEPFGGPRRKLREDFRNSIYRQTALVDGKVAAMWGFGGEAISDEAEMWLMTANAALAEWPEMVRLARAELEYWFTLRRRFFGYVSADYRGAIRLLQLLRFTIDDEIVTYKGVPYRRYWRER